MSKMTGIRRKTLISYQRGECGVPPDKLPQILNALASIEAEASTEQDRSERIRERTKRLAGGDYISGFRRVIETVANRGMTRARCKSIFLRGSVPTSEEANLLLEIIENCEREDCPVGPASLSGIVDRVIYPKKPEDRSAADNRAIFTVKVPGLEAPVIVSGYLPHVGTGLAVSIEGEWQYQEDYGNRIAATCIRVKLPASEPEIKAYLASGAVKGVGKTTAFKLVDRFGTNVFAVAAEQTERLATIKGLTTDCVMSLQSAAQMDGRTYRLEESVAFASVMGIPGFVPGDFEPSTGADSDDEDMEDEAFVDMNALADVFKSLDWNIQRN